MYDVNTLTRIFLLWLLAANPALAQDAGSEQAWFDDDWEQRAADVNEGTLQVLGADAGQDVHQHHTRLTITGQSLDDGWVSMAQCHRGLDPVPGVQIVYREGGVRNLRIDSSSNIGKAEVYGHVVDLEQVEHGASLCLSLQTRALHYEHPYFVLRNGPFMRRFLDGYYPMRVILDVDYSAAPLTFERLAPENLEQLAHARTAGLKLDVVFEGRLTTQLYFSKTTGNADERRDQ